MKKGFIFILILCVLFLGALLIYDFSDIPDPLLTNHEWYLIQKDGTYVLNLLNDKFDFKKIDTEESEYKDCHTYKYNNSSNIIKLDCNIKNNKLYIATYDENKLVVTINGEEKKLYKTEEMALEHNFMDENNLSENEYLELLNLKFDEDYYITYKEFNSLYKSKNTKNIVVVSNDRNYKNILNYKYLDNILTDNYSLINKDDLTEKELNDIYKKLKLTDTNSNSLFIYEIGNKKSILKDTIDIKNIEEINDIKENKNT